MNSKKKANALYSFLLDQLNQPLKNSILSDRIVASFLNNEEYKKLLLSALTNPSPQHIKEVDLAFKKHYTEVRFIKYVSMIIYYEAMHFNRKQDKRNEKVTLHDPAIDLSLEASPDTFLRTITDFEAQNELSQQIASKDVYEAFMSLTQRQQTILRYSYQEQLTDKEIAQKLSVSQQAISQSHQGALKKLKSLLKTHEIRSIIN
ncbi:sigma-70 family RNA polymerase sigma factor [Bacillus horti]|uniref:RNA polymerase sigma factor (Sigma-70 family) n=1 Tax=Caldalkalibacillus horti TaxID=77523 RepID=A0ABT9VXD8_9BACI|nr:sigma-70 family RNA polymerase sigma factor [Bacillus horti]MDQ0165654.1 RNA polymerase sigma factor (sigma-70 family) [Bacillus horti]